MRTRWLPGNSDLSLLTLIALLAMLVVYLDAPPVLRVVPALPLVFFAPGYVLHAVLFPAHPLPPLERVLIAFGGSIVVTILVGLLMAAIPIRLGPISWTAALATFTFVGAALAWFRRKFAPEQPELNLPPITVRDALPVAVAGIATIVILVGTRIIVADQEPAPPAQLWLLPGEDGSPAARLGMRSDGDGGDYTIRLTSAGVLLDEFVIQLDGGQVWERDVVFTDEYRQQPIVGRLYADAGATELRFVVLQPPGDAT